MVEANILCHEKFGIDAVTTMSDPYAETGDFGAEIEYPYNDNPICRQPFLKEHELCSSPQHLVIYIGYPS
jgi:uroporphyrinogen-III decarboxylase